MFFQKMTEAAVTAICAEINEALAACVAANVSQNKPFQIVYLICAIKIDEFIKFSDWSRMRTLDHSTPRMPRQEFLNVAWKAPYLPKNARIIFCAVQ